MIELLAQVPADPSGLPAGWIALILGPYGLTIALGYACFKLWNKLEDTRKDLTRTQEDKQKVAETLDAKLDATREEQIKGLAGVIRVTDDALKNHDAKMKRLFRYLIDKDSGKKDATSALSDPAEEKSLF